MKRNVLTLLSCLWIISGAIAQQTVNKEDLVEKNKIYYYQDKPFTGEGNGRTSSTDDPMKFKYVNGIPELFTGYFDEERTQLRWTVPIVNGKQHGTYIYYFENGFIGFRANIKNGKLSGKRYCYTEDGLLWHIHNYRKGKENGIRIVYNSESGKIYEEQTYRKDKLHGNYIRYTETGNVEITGHFKNGKKDGTWKIYSKDGNLRETQKYKADVLQKTYLP